MSAASAVEPTSCAPRLSYLDLRYPLPKSRGDTRVYHSTHHRQRLGHARHLALQQLDPAQVLIPAFERPDPGFHQRIRISQKKPGRQTVAQEAWKGKRGNRCLEVEAVRFRIELTSSPVVNST